MTTMQSSRSDWHPVSGCADLPIGSARAVMLHDEDIAIWRSESGKVQAWHNQCLHRGMRLSFGQVRGEQLSCRYHGWLFNKAGQCTRMPAQPSLKPAASICVPHFGCQERHDLIWVKLNDEKSATPENAFNSDADSVSWEFCKSLYIDKSVSDIVELTGSLRFPVPSAKKATELSYQSEEISSGVMTVTATGAELSESILLALHPLSAGKCGIHLCIASAATPEDRREKQLHFHAWAQRLRWFLQHPHNQYNGLHPFKADQRVSGVSV